MIINKNIENTTLTLAPVGRLDTATAPEFEKELEAALSGVEKLVIDLKDIDYISSAGLRVILKAQKIMSLRGSLKVTGANSMVMEVFEITGFIDIITIE